MPFAVKDNIDLAGLPTTAACAAFAYTPAASAVSVQQLLDAGAIAIGKTNLDQFATVVLNDGDFPQNSHCTKRQESLLSAVLDQSPGPDSQVMRVIMNCHIFGQDDE